MSYPLPQFPAESKPVKSAVMPQFGVASSLWLDIGAQRRHNNN
jgi:hypothetical protein